MKTWPAPLVVLAFSASCWGQSSPPPWPDIHLTSCPKITPTRALSERTWKHGQPEQDAYWAARSVKDPNEAVRMLERFVYEYPDSDYRDGALMQEWIDYQALKDARGELRVAEVMVTLPSAEALPRTSGFMTLAALFPAYVLRDDPEEQRKLADLDEWTLCGMTALAAEVNAPGESTDAFSMVRRYQESAFDRASGFVSLMREHYELADTELEAAASLNPQDALTYLWLFEDKTLSGRPDLNSAIFYFARCAELAPQVPAAADSLKRMYVLVHGSERGLDKVRTLARSNAKPPPGFTVLAPPKKERHYGTALAVAGIVGLLTYAVVKCPNCFAAAGGASRVPAPASSKIMIFAGPGHGTYLGCLSCGEFAPDSVFNEYGRNGSRYSSESIWNSYSQFGSPYSAFSACNPYASDPPVIVDENGNAYGRLTVNRYSPQIGAGTRFYNWLTSAVCRQ